MTEKRKDQGPVGPFVESLETSPVPAPEVVPPFTGDEEPAKEAPKAAPKETKG